MPQNDSPQQPSRRQFVKRIAAGGAGVGLLSSGALASNGHSVGGPSAEGFHFVHLTDMHVRRRRKGHIGYRTCVDHVNALQTRPDFVLMGGDMAFDGLYTEKDEFANQIELFRSISDRLEMPYYPCIGNHDVLGLSARRKVPVDDPDLGAKMIMDRLGMERSYYSFDHGDWHFVVLDTIYPVEADHGPSYVPRLGEEQLEWLRADLGAAWPRPTVVVMHIAAFCNIGQIYPERELPSMHGMVISDNRPFREILERHNVKAVLQGHAHMIEDYFWNGVWYVTSQSVSAAWWGGNWRGFKPGYTVFHANGEDLTWQRHEFAWEHHLEPEDDLERERIAEREAFEREQQRLAELERRGVVVGE
jgi:3',5'-cyclic-AMP phosphodiesterase